MIAALYVETNGCYFGLPNVDPWDIDRDARRYGGPYSVVAHPPCDRWGRYWSGGPNPKAKRRELGDDAGCFASALESVRRFGGLLEHPEASHAWRFFGLNAPPRNGGWIAADFIGGWTCCVEQGHYGHTARKATWLYAFGVEPPPPRSKEAAKAMRASPGFVPRKRIGAAERIGTPRLFRDLLISIASTAERKAA